MPVRTVESKDNARLKELRKALNTPARGAGALAGGASSLVGIEGPNLIQEAMRAGLRIKTIFVAQGAERQLDKLQVKRDVEVLELPKKLLDQALATESPQPIAALVERPNWSWTHLLNQNSQKTLVIVLAGIQDPGNLGTILRSAEAFGATGIVSLPGTVSAWNAKAVRASAGSVFRVPMMAASDEECIERLREAGVKIFAAAAKAKHPANLANLANLNVPLALVIGNEGSGVPDDLAAKTDGTISIPCPGPVESLNAAVAASVLLYQVSRQRSCELSGNPQHSSKASNRGAGDRQ